jgi:hypothetical protein
VVADYPAGLRTRRPGFKSQRLRFPSYPLLPSFLSRVDWEASTVIERFGGVVVGILIVHARSFAPADDHARASFTSGTIRERVRRYFLKAFK